MDSRLGARRWFGSLEVRLAAVTSLVLVLVSGALFFELAARERARLIAAKTSAASMVVALLATELEAPIDLGDMEGVTARLNELRTNPDVVAAAVWVEASNTPAAAWDVSGAPQLEVPGAEPDGAVTSQEWLVTTQSVLGPNRARLGRLRIAFSLAPENEAFRRNRLQLFWLTAGLAAATALLLGLLARRYLVGPLRRLAQAAASVAEGDLSARVDVSSSDEIGDLARAFNVMGKAVAFREERLRKEIDLAQHIQSSILPRTLAVPGLTIAASMTPTSEVGGDYYDVVPTKAGCWIGIGDVAGHGLDAGLIMLMIQAIAAALIARDPLASPKDVLCTLNEVLFDNIHNRLMRDDHATLTLLRYERSGRVDFAGAHEDILVLRASTGRCERVETPGTWVGGRRDIRRGTAENTIQLGPGDTMLLHTDGVTENRDRHGEHFGIERLSAEFERVAAKTPIEIVEHLVHAVGEWGEPEDDVSILVLRASDLSDQRS